MRAAAAARPIALGPTFGRSTVVLGGGLVLLTAIALVSVAVGTSGVGAADAGAVVLHRLFGFGSPTWPPASE
ncbi:MAG: hypothetical protein ACXWWO_03755, partial [Candidatus Limnocylindria bacterium]